MANDDEGMTKLGVELDDEMVKQSSRGSTQPSTCPTCGSKLDDARACPVHGTEPLEPTSSKRQ